MEKRKPSYRLQDIQRTFSSVRSLNLTRTALSDAGDIGFGLQDIVDVIAGMKPRMFYKSMTTYADPGVWQDVYHVPARGLILYVKFQADLISEFKVMAFKEK
jgi:motility quorum-sensing regulator/GCU-specific mRNA interferase toxin